MVWVPKLEGAAAQVPAARRSLSDGRATHFWDEGGRLMGQYTKVLALPEDAWDVYLVYGPAARWDGPEPPAPNYWMHQLGTIDRPRVTGPFLDGRILAARATALLPSR